MSSLPPIVSGFAVRPGRLVRPDGSRLELTSQSAPVF